MVLTEFPEEPRLVFTEGFTEVSIFELLEETTVELSCVDEGEEAMNIRKN